MKAEFLLIVFLMGMGVACSSSEEPQTDSKTNWLKICAEDGDCSEPGAACFCGVCTALCEDDGECADELVCADAESPAGQLQCGVEFAEGTCRPACASDDECPAGAFCTLGACTVADVPESSFCAEVEDWSAEDEALEYEMLLTLNEARLSEALPCSTGSVPPLVFDYQLRCAARVHALEMSMLGYSSVTSPDGTTAEDRGTSAGYPVDGWGASISQAANETPEEFISAISDQHGMGDPDRDVNCESLAGDYQSVGVGYFDGIFSIIYANPAP